MGSIIVVLSVTCISTFGHIVASCGNDEPVLDVDHRGQSLEAFDVVVLEELSPCQLGLWLPVLYQHDQPSRTSLT